MEYISQNVYKQLKQIKITDIFFNNLPPYSSNLIINAEFNKTNVTVLFQAKKGFVKKLLKSFTKMKE